MIACSFTVWGGGAHRTGHTDIATCRLNRPNEPTSVKIIIFNLKELKVSWLLRPLTQIYNNICLATRPQLLSKLGDPT